MAVLTIVVHGFGAIMLLDFGAILKHLLKPTIYELCEAGVPAAEVPPAPGRLRRNSAGRRRPWLSLSAL